MNMARIIGSVWATRKAEKIEGMKMKLIQPIDSDLNEIGSPIAATDSVGSGRPGELVYYTTSGEAPIPFDIGMVPTDATIIGIIDKINKYPKKQSKVFRKKEQK